MTGRYWRLGWMAGWLGIAGAGLAGGNYGGRVLDYVPGLGAGVLTNGWAALGEPSRETADPVWGTWGVDPFGPPYLASQLASLGAGGKLTLEFDRPVLDNPSNPAGLDFNVYGNAFLVTDGAGRATGELGGTNTGSTRILVSADGVHYYQLDPTRAPAPDAWWPTDGGGDFSVPVDPTLAPSDLVGQDLAGVRARLGGAGGGAGYDLAWAQDDQGRPVALQAVRFVRFEQLSGKADIDAVSACGRPVTLAEAFREEPTASGWSAFGTAELFAWNASQGWLEVTWDSREPNSYFYHPLGTVLSRVDDFALLFEMRLDSIEAGVDPGKPGVFQVAIGMVGWASAIRAELSRGAGMEPETGPRNTLEFDYFPDTGFGATVSPTLTSSQNAFASGFTLVELPLHEWLRIGMYYSSGDRTLRTRITRGVEDLVAVQDVHLGDAFGDLRLDTLAVCSFSDQGQDPLYAGSVLARGAIDNICAVLPPAPVDWLAASAPAAGGYAVALPSRPGWTYRLERTADLQRWTEVDAATAVGEGQLELRDTQAPPERAFYRVVAVKP